MASGFGISGNTGRSVPVYICLAMRGTSDCGQELAVSEIITVAQVLSDVDGLFGVYV